LKHFVTISDEILLIIIFTLFGLFIGCNDVETPLPQAIKLAILPLDVPSENSGERSLGISLADQISVLLQ